MKKIADIQYENLDLAPTGPIRAIELHKAGLKDVNLNVGTDRLLTIEGCALTSCRIHDVSVERCFFHDCRIQDMSGRGVLFLRDCAFSRVTLRGVISSFEVKFFGRHFSPPHAGVMSMRSQLASAYAGVDWAFDIREAEFVSAGFESVPADLVRHTRGQGVIVAKDAVTRSGAVHESRLTRSVRGELSRFMSGEPEEEFFAVYGRTPRDRERRARELRELEIVLSAG